MLSVQIELGLVVDASPSGALYYKRSILWNESNFEVMFDGDYCKRWKLEDSLATFSGIISCLQSLI